MATPIGTLGTIPSLTVGGSVFTDLTTLIVLFGRVTTATRYTTLRKPNGTAGYQVTAGKTLTIRAGQITNQTGTGSTVVQLLYGDTDVGLNSASAPTTPIYVAGETAVDAGVLSGATPASSTPYATTNSSVFFNIAAQKYGAIFVNGTGGVSTLWYGYEG